MKETLALKKQIEEVKKSAKKEGATVKERNGQIGGHKA